MSRNLAFPFHIGPLGVPRTSDRRASIRQQLEQVLFTIPGERVARPRFGAGVQRLVFEAPSAELLAAHEYQLSRTLRNHLGDEIDLEALKLSVEDASLVIDILYTVLRSGEEEALTYRLPMEGGR